MTIEITDLDEAFYGGIITALAVVALHDEQTIYEEIIGTLNKDELIHFARKNHELEFSGLVQYGYVKQPAQNSTG